MTDFEQLASWQAYRATSADHECLKEVQFRLWLTAKFAIHSVEYHGDNYRVNLLFWLTRTRYGSEPLRTQSALAKRVAKAGYVLLGYSDKADDMHLIVSESAKEVQK